MIHYNGPWSARPNRVTCQAVSPQATAVDWRAVDCPACKELRITERTPAERAYEVLDFIEAHPDKHDQAFWLSDATSGTPYTAARAASECGTTACFAGWTVLLAGLTVVGVDVRRAEDDIPTAAMKLLSLDGVDADALFHEAETLDDVREVVDEIFGPRP